MRSSTSVDAVLIVCLSVAFLLAYLYRDLHRSEHTWYATDSTQDDAMDIAQPGDLLFYRSSGTLIECLVVWSTSNGNPRADFVHVAIVKDARTIIQATWRGVVESPMPDLANTRIVGYRLPIASPDALTQALHGAQGQIGWKYGIADILSQFLRLLRLPFVIGRLHSLDCSHLAAEFAAWACEDATLYAMVCDEGEIISPNDLARYFGLAMPCIPAGVAPADLVATSTN